MLDMISSFFFVSSCFPIALDASALHARPGRSPRLCRARHAPVHGPTCCRATRPASACIIVPPLSVSRMGRMVVSRCASARSDVSAVTPAQSLSLTAAALGGWTMRQHGRRCGRVAWLTGRVCNGPLPPHAAMRRARAAASPSCGGQPRRRAPRRSGRARRATARVRVRGAGGGGGRVRREVAGACVAGGGLPRLGGATRPPRPPRPPLPLWPVLSGAVETGAWMAIGHGGRQQGPSAWRAGGRRPPRGRVVRRVLVSLFSIDRRR